MKVLALAAVALAAAGALHPNEFRWTRTLSPTPGTGPIFFEPDASLFAHAG
jgi:hypothetical protein